MNEFYAQLQECTGFAWDSGNQTKSFDKHGVTCSEAEDVFFLRPLLLLEDFKHRGLEKRLHAFGFTAAGRPLAVTFTIRDEKIRIISARDQNQKELKTYGFQR
ncbi:MAG: BrnT family toxin [Terrimicrobiaceae bacterium]